jgi:hypothetical protein
VTVGGTVDASFFEAMEARDVSEHARRGTGLDQWLPEYEFSDTIAVPVHASSKRLFRAFSEITTRDMPLASLLGKLRYLPGRLLGRLPEAPRDDDQPFVRQLIEGGAVVLAEEPRHEMVLGTIGKFHQVLNQEPVSLRDAAEFGKFGDPAYQKLVMGLRIEEDSRGKRLVLEHRTHALSRRSRRAFARYWIVIKPTGHFVSWLLLRAVRRRAKHPHAGAHLDATHG